MAEEKKHTRMSDDELLHFKNVVSSRDLNAKIESTEHDSTPVHLETMYDATGERYVHSVILRTKQKVTWTGILSNFILLQDKLIWRIFVLTYLFSAYLCTTLQLVFLRETYYIIQLVGIVVHIIFGVDFVLATTIYFWKNLQLKMVNSPRGYKLLLVDALLVIPYDLIYFAATGDVALNEDMAAITLIPHLRMYHIMRFFGDMSSSAGIKHWNYFIMEYMTYLVLINHTVACLQFYMACSNDCLEPTGWLSSKNQDNSTRNYYIYSSYFAFMALSNIGLSNFLSTNTPERIITSLTIMIGFVVTTGVFIGALSADFFNHFNRFSCFKMNLEAINKHLTMIHMDLRDINKIMNYYDMFWKKKKGVKQALAMQFLPHPLQNEICFDVNFNLLQSSLLFKNQPEPFLRTLSVNMKHEFHQPGDIIYTQHTTKYKMLCVASGIIEILSDEDDESPIISFSAGTVLGEAALFLTLPARATVRAANYCELQVLYKKDFINMIQLYPEIFQYVRKSILERLKHAYNQKDEAASYEINKLSLHVSQKRKFSAIKRVKLRLSTKMKESQITDRRIDHKCALYRYVRNVKKKQRKYIFRTATFPWILEPDTNFMKVWEIIVVISIIIVCVLYPYYIGFQRKFSSGMSSLAAAFDTIYLLDVCIIVTTAIEEKDYTISNFWGILNKRMSTVGFYMDCLAIFPLEFLAFEQRDRIFYAIKLNRMLKSYRIYTFFKKLESNQTANVLAIRLIKYPLYIMFSNYWFGVLLYWETCFDPICTEDGWFMSKVQDDQEYQLASPCTDHEVIMTLYFGSSCLSTLGIGDITPGNIQDMLFICFGGILGILIFGYCTSELSATITHSINLKVEFQGKMFAVKKFMEDNNMKKAILERVIKFFELQWNYNRGIEFVQKGGLLDDATEKIRTQVILKERLAILESIPLFQHTDPDFVNIVAAGARTVILPPGEIVTYCGGSGREMYIIQEGHCAMELSSGQKDLLKPGRHFGVHCVILNTPNWNTIRTITHAKLIAIEYSVLHSAASMFPKVQNEIHIASTVGDMARHYKGCKPQSDLPTRPKQELYNWMVAAMKTSFVHVPSYCKYRDEDFNKPYRMMGYMYWIKFLLSPYIFEPEGFFLKVWVTIRFIQAILLALLTPIQQIMSPYVRDFDIIMSLLDFIAILDLYFMMFVPYYGEQNQLIIHPLKTAMRYIKGTFFVDLLFCFPWEEVVLTLIPEHDEGDSAFSHSLSPHYMHCTARLFRIFQLYRLQSFFIYLEDDIKIKGYYIQLVKYIPFTYICINVSATFVIMGSCKFYHISDLPENSTIGSYAAPPGMGGKNTQEFTMFCEKDSWIERSIFHDYVKPLEIYLLAIYWCTALVVGSGFGDVTPQNVNHVILNIALIVIGLLFFGYIFAAVSSYKAEISSLFSHYQEMILELKTFFYLENITSANQSLLLNHILYRWKRNKGAEPNDILAKLHTALHEDAVVYMYENTLREVPLFESAEITFFRTIGRKLREQYYGHGSPIARQEDVIDEMFIIHRGKVEITFPNGYQMFVGVGGIFGALENKAKSKMGVTVTALSNTDLLSLKTPEFHEILKKYPSIVTTMDHLLNQDHPNYIIPSTYVVESDTASLASITGIQEELRRRSSVHFLSSRANFQARVRLPFEGSDSDSGGSDPFQTKAEDKLNLPGRLSTSSVMGKERKTNGFLLLFQVHKWFQYAILPDSPAFITASILCLIGGYLNAFIVIYHFAFQDQHVIFLYISIVLDVVFFWKIFLELHKAHLDRYSEYVTNMTKIWKKYFSERNKRIADIIGNIPIAYIALAFYEIYDDRVVNLIFTTLKLLSLFRLRHFIEYFVTRSEDLTANQVTLSIAFTAASIFLMLHTFSCLWYLMACPLVTCFENSWAEKIFVVERPNYEIYVLSLYYFVNVATNTACGDITPVTHQELIFITIIMVVAKYSVGIFLGTVTNVMSERSANLVRYEEYIKELKDYLQNENVSNHQLEKMWNYVRQLWAKRRGRQVPRLFKMIPYTNKCYVKYEIYRGHLENSYIFNNLEEAFIRQLCYYVEPVVFFPGNYIVQHGDSDQSMYFVHRGEVDVLTVHPNLTESIHDVLQAGDLFGVAQGLFYGIAHHFSFRAKTTVDVGVLTISKWDQLLRFFPEVGPEIYARARSLYQIV